MRSGREFAFDEEIFDECKVWPLVGVILPAATDEIGEALVCGLRDERTQTFPQLLLDRASFHGGEWNFASL